LVVPYFERYLFAYTYGCANSMCVFALYSQHARPEH